MQITEQVTIVTSSTEPIADSNGYVTPGFVATPEANGLPAAPPAGYVKFRFSDGKYLIRTCDTLDELNTYVSGKTATVTIAPNT